jgi:arylsulfatase A-like enzyme
LGENPPGFDSSAILPGQGRYVNPQLITKEGTTMHPGHVSDVLTQLAVDWLGTRDTNKPFLLCVHHKAAHMPWEPAARHWELFAEKTFPEPPTLFDPRTSRADCLGSSILTIENLGRWQKKWPIPETGDRTERVRSTYQTYMRYYAATAAGIDESVGKLLDFLDAHGLSENTMVIYSSDQGFFLGEHGWFDKRWMLEESQRLPLVVRYPRLTKPQQVSRALVLNLDVAPTLLELASIPIPADMQGLSLVPLFSGKTPRDWRRAVYYRYYDRQYGIPPHLGIRTERYKLIHYKGPAAIDNGTDLPPITKAREVDEWELFDLQKDPDETQNLFSLPKSQRLVRRLNAELQKIQHAIGERE